jgi:hypothetical protein
MLEVEPELRVMLRALHVSGMADNFVDLATKAATAHLTYESFLAEVVRCECTLREQRRIARLLRQSGLPLDKTFRTLQLDRFPLNIQQQVEHVRSGAFTADAICPAIVIVAQQRRRVLARATPRGRTSTPRERSPWPMRWVHTCERNGATDVGHARVPIRGPAYGSEPLRGERASRTGARPRPWMVGHLCLDERESHGGRPGPVLQLAFFADPEGHVLGLSKGVLR